MLVEVNCILFIWQKRRRLEENTRHRRVSLYIVNFV